MLILEKLEECPECGECKFWSYDGQMCANCGHGEPGSEHKDGSFHTDRMDAWIKELWAAKSVDLHMCDGTVRVNQSGLLCNVRDDVMAARKKLAETRATMAKLLVSANILLANAHDCVVNHHLRRDGEPGWLADCRRDIEEAAKVTYAT